MKQAFSLVELSIVLVILGLLTGGILAGQSLIRAAELRTVTTQYNTFAAAVGSFRDKYFAIPGDMTNAAKFWGYAGGTTGTDAACYGSTTGTGTQTCNGNGNGSVAFSGVGNQYNEGPMFWQHLTNAGLIEGAYTGKAGAGSGFKVDIGVNAPAGKISRSGWAVQTDAAASGDMIMYDGGYTNALYFGTISPTYPSSYPQGGVLKPEETWNIDTKMDDGKPGTGALITFKPVMEWYGCAASGATNSDYALSSTTSSCLLIFRRFINNNN